MIMNSFIASKEFFENWEIMIINRKVSKRSSMNINKSRKFEDVERSKRLAGVIFIASKRSMTNWSLLKV